MSGVPKHRALPDKENKLFKELLTQYELKQYKKGLKAADTILKKHPNHGETLALKALTIHASLPFPATASSLPKQEEAEAMARTAIKKDMTSHITWHVLGILAKSRKDWEEASRAFNMARKQDSDNIPLIRDSISLYLHTRQFAPALAARHHYLLLRPQLRSSWLGLMISHELCGDLDEALQVYDGLLSTLKTDGATGPEKSQTLMHVIKICMRKGDLVEALARLERGLGEKTINPRGEATQLKAEILVKLGRTAEAEDTYRALLEQNPDNLEYYRGFLRTRGVDISTSLNDESTAKVLHALSGFAESYPRSTAPRRMALDIARGYEFRELARKYLVSGLERGIPSLFVDVKGVYSDFERMAIVGEILEDIVAGLEKDEGKREDDSVPPSSTLLWAYYYLALHLSHPSHPNPSHSRSMELLDIALQHTPTLPEIQMAKAMVLKRAGDPVGAAQAMQQAQELDGQDRFLNGKLAKYVLRAGDVKRAEDLLALFTKQGVNPVVDLADMQCLWFLMEEGDAYRRIGTIGMALKRYQQIVTIFQDYEDDQYDFHTYCMRRMTLSAYMSLMRYEDQLRSHPAYFRAASSAIDLYLKIHDDPSMSEEKLTAEEEAERKRSAKKAQKAEQKAKKAAATSGDGKKEEAPVPDDDPNGEKLLKTETPLEDAAKLLLPLEKLASERIETWTTAYEIESRRGDKLLSALHCLLEAHAIDPENPTLHKQVLHFRHTLSAAKDLPPPVKSTIDALFPSILPTETSSEEYNTNFLSRHSKSPSHILGAAKGLLEINKSGSAESIESILTILNHLTETGVPPNIPIMLEAMDLLREAKASGEEVERFRKRCRERVPLAWVLASSEEQVQRKQEVSSNGKVEVNGHGNGNGHADL